MPQSDNYLAFLSLKSLRDERIALNDALVSWVSFPAFGLAVMLRLGI